MPLLTFIIPVRHHKNARDWSQLCLKLSETARSISNQTNADWRGVIVANAGCDLPALPSGFTVVRVDFPPNEKHQRDGHSLEEFHDAVRADKGRRILKGMLAANDSQYFMAVDDDDLISSRIVEFVRKNDGENGWILDHGYIWTDGGKFLIRKSNFHKLCGTSIIVRSDLYNLPDSIENSNLDWTKRWLGSHIFIEDLLKDSGFPLSRLPFHGAIYRVGHAESHSQSNSIISTYFVGSGETRTPIAFIRNASRLRWITPSIRREFFGQEA